MDYITWSRDQKSHVAPYFNGLDLRNTMVQLTILFTSCDANTDANGVSNQKCDGAPHFNHY